MICGHGHEQKFEDLYPWDSKIIQMPYPRAEATNQIPILDRQTDRHVYLEWIV